MNKQIIPELSGPDGTDIAHYRRFANLSAYLQECGSKYPINFKQAPDLIPMLKACGMGLRRSQKIRVLKQQWELVLTERIPIGFLDYIGATRENIEKLAEKDMEAFLYFSKEDLRPKTYTIRLMAAVYTGGLVPDNMTLEEAIDWVQAKVHHKHGFCFNFPSLKTVYVNRDDSINTIWYTPEIKWKKDFLITGKNGSMVGKTYIR